MNIYKSSRVLPYVYMSQEKGTDRFYIGYRFANKVPSSDDFGTHYFTSNQYVKDNFDKFDHQILAEFFNKKDALKFESELITQTRCANQINEQRVAKLKLTEYKKREVYVEETKVCPLPECQKIHTNWRMKCCCISHQKRYAAFRSHSTGLRFRTVPNVRNRDK